MSSSSSPQGEGRYAAAASGPTAPSSTTKRGRAPASNEAILGLRQIAAADCSSGECAICLHEFASDAPEAKQTPQLRALPCSHAFHQHCIFRWLRRNAVCPLCRHQLPSEEEDDDEDERRYRTRMGFSALHHPTQEEHSLTADAVARGVIEDVQEQDMAEKDPEEWRRWMTAELNRWTSAMARARKRERERERERQLQATRARNHPF